MGTRRTERDGQKPQICRFGRSELQICTTWSLNPYAQAASLEAHMRFHVATAIVVVAILVGHSLLGAELSAADTFDQRYRAYAELLRAHVVDGRVDYLRLKSNRAVLDDIVSEVGRVTESQLKSWSTQAQIAYWINAYNVFTLQAIVDHYPIEWRWLSLLTLTPRNSIKQIPGVWTDLRWDVAGTRKTLDEIEHETLRPLYQEPRIHVAVNCASISCPPLRVEPYVGEHLDRQLILAARDYLASDLGLQVDGSTLRLSSLFDWYGDDFIDDYAHLVEGDSDKERAILGLVATYGPTDASRLAQSGIARIRYLRYDWVLNDLRE